MGDEKELAKDVHEALVISRLKVAEAFYYHWLAADISKEDQIAAIDELISYGDNPALIARKMALDL